MTGMIGKRNWWVHREFGKETMKSLKRRLKRKEAQQWNREFELQVAQEREEAEDFINDMEAEDEW